MYGKLISTVSWSRPLAVDSDYRFVFGVDKQAPGVLLMWYRLSELCSTLHLVGQLGAGRAATSPLYGAYREQSDQAIFSATVGLLCDKRSYHE